MPNEWNGIALRVADVHEVMSELGAAGAEVIGIEDSGVCHMGFVKDPDGNVLILHCRYAARRSVDGAELLERYRELPLPTTSDEPWRFTDLKGFDPDRYRSEGHVQGLTPGRVDARHRRRRRGRERGRIEIERAPEGITFEPLLDDHPRLHELVELGREVRRPQRGALASNGLLVVIPKASWSSSRSTCA